MANLISKETFDKILNGTLHPEQAVHTLLGNNVESYLQHTDHVPEFAAPAQQGAVVITDATSKAVASSTIRTDNLTGNGANVVNTLEKFAENKSKGVAGVALDATTRSGAQDVIKQLGERAQVADTAAGAARHFVDKDLMTAVTKVEGASAEQIKAVQDKLLTAGNARIEAVGAAGTKMREAATKYGEHAEFKVEIPKATYTPAGGATGPNVAGKVLGEKGYIGASAYKEIEGSMFKREFQNVKSNFQNGWAGTAKVAVGGLAVLDGARRAYQGLTGMMSSDPEKQEQAGLGTLVVGIGEIAGGAALARWGGKAAATGMAI